MIKVNVLSEENSWSKKIKKKELFFNNICNKFPKKYRFINKKIYLTLLLSNNKKIKILNKKFRNKNKHTDVLSFPFNKKINSKKNVYLGDIAISYEIINKRSKNSNFFLEFDKMWIHGYLHLLGYNHKREKDFSKMRKLENLILNFFYKKEVN